MRLRGAYGRSGKIPEQHDAMIIDVLLVQSGEGTSQLGGDRHPLGPGDIVHIPAGVPHAFLVPEGKHLTYALLKIPATHQK